MIEIIVTDRPLRPEKGSLWAEVPSPSHVDLELGLVRINCWVLQCKWHAIALISIRDMVAENDFTLLNTVKGRDRTLNFPFRRSTEIEMNVKLLEICI